MTLEELRGVVDGVLRTQLDKIGYESSDVAEAFDHDGDPILQVTIHYRKIGQAVDPTPTFSLARHLRAALRDRGETRFPHFTHLFPEDQELKVA